LREALKLGEEGLRLRRRGRKKHSLSARRNGHGERFSGERNKQRVSLRGKKKSHRLVQNKEKRRIVLQEGKGGGKI